MAAAGNLIFTAAIAVICMYRGWSKEAPYYSVYVRDLQTSNTLSDADHKGTAHLKRRYSGLGGNTNYQYHNQLSHTGNNAHALYEFCSNYQEYNTLLQLKDNKSCLRAIDVWPLLESLNSHNQHNPDEGTKCRVQVIQLLSAAFGNIDTSPDYCQCHGYVKISHFPNIIILGMYFILIYIIVIQTLPHHLIQGDFDVFQNCWNDGDSEHNYYQKIYSEYYNDDNSYGRQCTHHHIWNTLSKITDVVCQRNLIINLAYTFKHYHPAFECSQVSSVHQSTHQVESITSTPTPSHFPETTTTDTPQTTQTRAIKTCDKYATISNLAHETIFSHPAASDCSHSDHRASEALVFHLCHTNDTHSWIKGTAVLENCSQIPLYAPVATFIQDLFIPSGGQAGIFLGCLPNGFKWFMVAKAFGTETFAMFCWTDSVVSYYKEKLLDVPPHFSQRAFSARVSVYNSCTYCIL